MTASNFGRVLNRKSEKILNNLFNHKSISALSLEYGKRNEPKAKSKYLNKFNNRHLHECGLIVNKEFLFLGGTPDGKVCDDGNCGIIECKCPYSARNFMIDEAIDKIPNFMLQYISDGSKKLNRNHVYYSQVQGQLMVSGADFCDFVVFTQKDLFVQRIFPDIAYMTDMLVKLSLFFQNYAKQHLL